MEKIIAYSVEGLYKKVAEQGKRISEIEMRLGIKPAVYLETNGEKE